MFVYKKRLDAKKMRRIKTKHSIAYDLLRCYLQQEEQRTAVELLDFAPIALVALVDKHKPAVDLIGRKLVSLKVRRFQMA